MRVIGLTGGIACGKSSVAAMLFENFHVELIDADELARQVVEPGEPALQAIVEHFSSDVLYPDGSLDRRELRRRIVTSDEDRAALNAITHPAIAQAMQDEIAKFAAQGATDVFIEAALMVETGSYKLYPELVVVSCTPATQIVRIMVRDRVNEEQAKGILATQLDMAEKEAVATRIIRNDKGMDALKRMVFRLAKDLGLRRR
ncbi:MAG: dephospho-CoA kinase [Proteobacteria bacterium]|nr:dephospho-CoA kinase [Pseudomonadota bacterium]